jgi:hypothetical protein
MTTPGLGRAVELAHMLVLLSRIVALEQQPKPGQKSLKHSGYKCSKDTYLPVPHCSHFGDMRMAWALCEFDFLVGVRLRTEE